MAIFNNSLVQSSNSDTTYGEYDLDQKVWPKTNYTKIGHSSNLSEKSRIMYAKMTNILNKNRINRHRFRILDDEVLAFIFQSGRYEFSLELHNEEFEDGANAIYTWYENNNQLPTKLGDADDILNEINRFLQNQKGTLYTFY